MPAGIITAMGTQIRVDDRPLKTWDARFAGWPRDEIFNLVRSLGHRPHDDEFQTQYKASFAVPRGDAQHEVTEAINQKGLPCRIIASGTDDLDILAPGAGKDHATLFLTESLGFKLPQLIVAGDSANDLAMFKVAPRAIAVGNARPELIDAMPKATSYHAKAHHAAGVAEGLAHFRVV